MRKTLFINPATGCYLTAIRRDRVSWSATYSDALVTTSVAEMFRVRWVAAAAGIAVKPYAAPR